MSLLRSRAARRDATAASAADRPVIETSPRDASDEPTWLVAEVGSFSHGECLECAWRGPGRRARASARKDAELHSLAGCGDVERVRSLFPEDAFTRP